MMRILIFGIMCLLRCRLQGLILPQAESEEGKVVDCVINSIPNGIVLGPNDAVGVVRVAKQSMIVRAFGKVAVYRISTAKAGEGSQNGSGKTPLGWHKVKYRFGAGAQVGQLFVGRKKVKGAVRTQNDWHLGNGDEVLSRIFWLDGLDSKLNKDPKGRYDSFQRHIYIHGTNQEALLGTPASHGCIRMGNHDVVELFDFVKPCKNFYIYITGHSKRVGQ